ncbi:zinc finger protein ZAT12-like [Momordica charantia]|uniref:Zinc finger protein ZAT12-like n=1 Tax=Momordica charantia TaxID=3673 RepID=A0A6J1DVW1_MOMCH|nr:zinc finger protein ZAT12-like [Momordica charantia]
MKREREEGELEVFDMVDSLMLLSRVGEYNNDQQRPEEPQRKNSSPAAADSGNGKVLICKTCKREFKSFQALGGHRASHGKAKFMDVNSAEVFNPLRPPPAKSGTHQCPVCGLQFPIGQALGGHMRRHRSTAAAAAVLKKSDGREVRVFGVDLNLAPVDNNNLKLQLMTPFVDCFN